MHMYMCVCMSKDFLQGTTRHEVPAQDQGAGGFDAGVDQENDHAMPSILPEGGLVEHWPCRAQLTSACGL